MGVLCAVKLYVQSGMVGVGGDDWYHIRCMSGLTSVAINVKTSL